MPQQARNGSVRRERANTRSPSRNSPTVPCAVPRQADRCADYVPTGTPAVCGMAGRVYPTRARRVKGWGRMRQHYVGLISVMLLDYTVLDWSRQGVPAVNNVLDHYIERFPRRLPPAAPQAVHIRQHLGDRLIERAGDLLADLHLRVEAARQRRVRHNRHMPA